MPDAYLCDLLIHYRPSRTLRSSGKELLVQAHCHLKTYGERAFSFIAPKLWNTKLWSAGDNDRKVKTLLLHQFTLRKFHVTDSQNMRDQITSNRRSTRAFCVFHSFLVEVQMNAVYVYIHATHV